MRLRVLSGGAARAVVEALAEQFLAETGYRIDATFSAVGAMRKRLLDGEPADLVILTSRIVDALASEGWVRGDSCRELGRVPTCIAVRGGDPHPRIADAAALRECLRAAQGIYCPDLQHSTAGTHFARVLESLGLATELGPRLRCYPNGHTAMSELARGTGERLIGCTQATEIKGTPGVELVGALGGELALVTAYAAAVCARSSEPEVAQRLVALLAGPESRELRARAGFAAD